MRQVIGTNSKKKGNNVHSGTIYNSQDMEATYPSTDEWIKMWYTYTMEYYLAIEKNEIMPFAATWMDLQIDYYTKWSKSDKDKYDIAYLWNLKYDTNEFIYKTEIDSQIQKTNL